MMDIPTSNRANTLNAVFKPVGVIGLLVVILLAGASLRLVGLDWDENHHLHPDERFLTMVVSATQPVASLGQYFDTPNSTLNPNNLGYGFFVYGDLPIVLTRYAGEAVEIILTRYVGEEVEMTDYYHIYLVGRVLSTAADLLTIIILFFIGRTLFDSRVGLLAAGLYAAAGLPIQLSHFFAVDTFTNLFAAGAFLFAVRAYLAHRWPDYPLFGLMLGLGLASKVSIFPLALILILALALRINRELGDPPAPNVAPLPTRRLILRAAIGLALAGLVTVLIFRVAQPYAFLPPRSGIEIDGESLGPAMSVISAVTDPVGLRPNPLWLDQMAEARRQVSGFADIPPNHQWGHRLPLVFPWINMVSVGMGWPLGVFCWLAFAWAIWEIARRHRGADRLILPAVWIGLFFTWQGIDWVKTMRYFLPLYPLLILLAGWALTTLWDRVQVLLQARGATRWRWPTWIVVGITAVVAISAYGWGFAVSRIYTRPVTRVAASQWIFENVPSDVTLIIETPDGQREFQLGLPNNWSPDDPSPDDVTRPQVAFSQLLPGLPMPVSFEVPYSGALTAIRFNHVLDPAAGSVRRTLHAAVTPNPDTGHILAEGEIRAAFRAEDDPRGETYELSITPVDLVAGEPYFLTLEADERGPLVLSGANIAVEGQWDDPLPLSLAPYNVWGAQFQGYELQLHWEDIEEKRARLQYILDRADYIVISSNRFYASMPRNPDRYPLTIAYYEALFSGDLGFELVADFTSRPNIGPVEFYDDTAEEAWTVYDHPRVMIFRRTEDYDAAHTAEILGSVDLNTIVRKIANQAAGPPLILHPPELSAELPTDAGGQRGLDFFRQFQPLTVILWWLLIAVIGWLGFPILYAILPGLPDRGFTVSRIFSLLMAAWLAWMFASLNLIAWGAVGAVLALGLTALLSAVLIVPRRAEFLQWLRDNRARLIFTEGLLAVLFIAFLLVRLGNPDLWHPIFGGEKPMDMAYFNAVLNSGTFPPYDPWFAGGTINYYYFGFVIVGLPLKLLPIPVTIAYNLIVPTLFSLTGAAAFASAYNLLAPVNGRATVKAPARDELTEQAGLWQALRAWPRTSAREILRAAAHTLSPRGGDDQWVAYIAGIGAVLLAVVLGNLDQIRTLLWGLAELGSGSPAWPSTLLPRIGDIAAGISLAVNEGRLLPVGLGEWYWNATRLIPVPIGQTGQPLEIGPITEFPFFTFLYGDLHAHMIAMPVTLLAVNWCIGQMRGAGLEPTRGRWHIALNVLAGALIIGALRPTNTWDWPTYLMLGAGALTLAHFRRRANDTVIPALGLAVIGGLVAGGGVFLLGAGLSPVPDPALGRLTLIAAVGAGIVGLLAGYAVGLLFVRRADSDSADRVDSLTAWLTLLGALLSAALLAGLTFILYLPYILNYHLAYTSAIPWQGSRTPLWAYLDILGLFLFLILSWMALDTWQWLARLRQEGRLRRAHLIPAIIALAACIGLSALVAGRGLPIAALILPLIIWAAGLFLRGGQTIEKRAVLAMLILALVLSLTVEVVVLQGDISRMNTVFKFYLQIWLLMAVAAGASLGWLWPHLAEARETVRLPWATALITLIFLAALYPLLATRAKIADRWSDNAPHTLDGMAYMPYVIRDENGTSFSLAPDYYALHWLQENIEGRPVVLEAQTVEYFWGSRVSVYTGLPTLIGWNWHQRQQRPEQSAEVWQRVGDVQLIYDTTDIAFAEQMLDRYGVDLIIVGDLERAYYDPAGLAKFDQMVEMGYLTVLYDRDNTVIYRVAGGAP